MSTSLTIVPRGSRRNGSQGGSRRGGNRGGNRRHNGGNRGHHSRNGVGGGGRDLSMWMSAASADLQKQRKQQSRRSAPKSKPIEVANAFDVLDNLQPARKQAKHNPKPVPKFIETPLQPQGAWGKVSPATLSTPAVQKKALANVKAKFQKRFGNSRAKQQDEQALAKRLRVAEDLIEMQQGTIASLETENRRLRDENADLQDTATAAIDEVSKKGILKAGGIRFKGDNPETMMKPAAVMTLVYNAAEKVDSLVTGKDASMVKRTRAKQLAYLQEMRSSAGVKQNPANAAEAAAAAAEHHRELMAEQDDETELFAKSGGAGAWKPKRKRVAGGGGAAIASAPVPVPATLEPFGDRSGEWGATCCEADDSW